MNSELKYIFKHYQHQGLFHLSQDHYRLLLNFYKSCGKRNLLMEVNPSNLFFLTVLIGNVVSEMTFNSGIALERFPRRGGEKKGF
jgi:hypothetical protein